MKRILTTLCALAIVMAGSGIPALAAEAESGRNASYSCPPFKFTKQHSIAEASTCFIPRWCLSQKGMVIMNKVEMISAMANRTGMARKDCEAALSAFIDITIKAMQGGDKVQLVGFGTFEVKSCRARPGVNPQSGARITIPAHRVPIFRPGKHLKNGIN